MCPAGIYPRTAEHCAHIAAALRGRTLSPEHRAAIAKAPVTFTLMGNHCKISFPFLWGRIRLARRSRIVWMLAHRQSLPRYFVVHHINEVQTDDRPENLALMFKREHHRWHNWENGNPSTRPEVRMKISASTRRRYEDPAEREKTSIAVRNSPKAIAQRQRFHGIQQQV